MRRIACAAAVAVILAGVASGGIARAEETNPPAKPDAKPEARPAATADAPSVRPKLPRDKRTQLEGLFAALKVAPDDRSAKLIADRLEQLFGDTGSPSVDLLMARATMASEAKQYDLALRLLDQVLVIEPDDIAARTKRATIYYVRDDYGAALADIREILAREPRHFAMLYGLALILRDIGEEKLALDAARKALAINPRLDGAKEIEGQLVGKVEGRGI